MTARTKLSLRESVLARRSGLSAEYRDGAAASLVHHVLSLPGMGEARTVSGFLAIRDEIDLMPAMDALSARGRRIVLPVMSGKGRPLIFRAWEPGAPLEKGSLGTRVPGPGAETGVPDILLVPLLAFDRSGYRLGYGGGYYDRTLEELRATREILAAGIGFDEQEVDSVPREAHDQRLDWMVTPSGAYQTSVQ